LFLWLSGDDTGMYRAGMVLTFGYREYNPLDEAQRFF